MNHSNKRIAINAVLNTVKTIFGIIFPLITFPYVTRVLGAEKLGVYTFSASIVSYFLLIAALGISTYGIREGTQYRDNKERITTFVSELFSINLISTIIAYAILFFCLFLVPKLFSYRLAILILSFEIIAASLGSSWICNIYEDFLSITIRTIVFQFVSLVLTLLLVRSSEDLYKYAAIVAFANSGSNLLNFFYVRKRFCRFTWTFHIDWKKHLRPILIIFSTSVAITVYVSSDTTMLGFMTSDFFVGLYGAAVKIYTILKSVLSAVLTVLIPQFAIIFSNHETEKGEKMFSQVFNLLNVLMLPMIVGLFLVSDDVILLIAGEEYIKATGALRILSIAILFSLYAFLYVQCILIPCKKENVVFKATIVSAVANIVLNIILIPRWGIYAASITTVIAEAVTFIIVYLNGRKTIRLENIKKNILKTVVGCIGISIVCISAKAISSFYVRILTSILASIVVYLVIELMAKNDAIIEVMAIIKRRGEN